MATARARLFPFFALVLSGLFTYAQADGPATAAADNQRPTANAGPDQTVGARTAVTLPGSGSDTDGSVVAYRWKQVAGPAVTLAGAGLASATFTAPAATELTRLTFRLTVRDDQGATDSDRVSVTVKPRQSARAEQWVMGYYAAYQRDLYPPEQIDWSGLTHVVMARVKANADGSLDTRFDWDPSAGPALAMDVAARAHAAGKKAILMLGGDDNGVQIRAAVTHHRPQFIANLVGAMVRYGYDGLDLDWENNIDWDLFQAFVSELRQAAPQAILTLPIGPLNINYEVVEPRLPALAKQIDRVNLMSYYPATAWAGSGWLSWHNSALKGVKPATPVTIEESFQRLVAAGIPRKKLGMGIAFYAICYTGGITAPNQSTEDGVTIEGGDNDYPLSELFGTNGAYAPAARRWDEVALAPYLSLPQPERHGCRYVSFDDEQSIIEKGRFSRENGYGGIIIWTINQGHVKTHSEPAFLLEALRKGFIEPTAERTVGLSVMQGNTWVRTGAQVPFSALVTGTADQAVSWVVVEPGCGDIDAQGLYTAPGVEQTCTVTATSHADPSRTAAATVTVSNTAWTPGFTLSRPATWWVEVTAQDVAVASLSVLWSDGQILPLTRWGSQWGTNYPIFAANYGFPDAGGVYTFYARSADNRAAAVQLEVPACVHAGDGACQPQ